MRKIMMILSCSAAMVACQTGPTTAIDGDANVGSDAMNVSVDAMDMQVTDINPPLTPDDPCRQLKLEFDHEVLSADAARLGEWLVVAYQTADRTGAVLYQNDILQHSVVLPAGQPKLFVSRDEIHVTTGGEDDQSFDVLELRMDGTVSVVADEMVIGGQFWHVFGTVSDADDLLISWGSSASAFSHYVNGSASGAALPTDYFARAGGSGDWWPIRTGSGSDARISAGEVMVVTSNLGMPPTLSTRRVEHRLTGGLVAGGELDLLDYPVTVSTPILSAVLETEADMVIAMDHRSRNNIEYHRTTLGDGTLTFLSNTPSARLATYGAPMGQHSAGNVSAVFVEHVISDDGLSGTWRLVAPDQQRVLAIGRPDLAGRQDNPGSLTRSGTSLVWAGPTIRDGKTSNYPHDAIAVCEVLTGL